MFAGDARSNFELVVMLAMLKLRGTAYGANLRRRIEDETEQTVIYGSLYVALERLEEKGWIRSQPGPSSIHRRGKPKKVYHFTIEGLKRFGETGANVQSLLDCEDHT